MEADLGTRVWHAYGELLFPRGRKKSAPARKYLSVGTSLHLHESWVDPECVRQRDSLRECGSGEVVGDARYVGAGKGGLRMSSLKSKHQTTRG